MLNVTIWFKNSVYSIKPLPLADMKIFLNEEENIFEISHTW